MPAHRQVLQAADINPANNSTHSFRRGGKTFAASLDVDSESLMHKETEEVNGTIATSREMMSYESNSPEGFRMLFRPCRGDRKPKALGFGISPFPRPERIGM